MTGGEGAKMADSLLLFDQRDHELLSIVNQTLSRVHTRKYLKQLFDPYLHPNGIKEMAAPKELRIAYAVIHLLDALEVGSAEDRIMALRSVRDEVLHCARSTLRINTGRVLLQIMKELVRAHGDYRRQLELAHDFRAAFSGKPRLIREQLERYHLLEMPEEWNQMTFDDHVHDSNTKGRKSPTHLIMDAWIKGIRALTVIYYYHVRPEAARELLEAAEIMGIRVRIGLEFAARFRGRFVQFIWAPRGFSGSHDFLDFLAQPEVSALMLEGRAASEWRQGNVFKKLEDFNNCVSPEVNKVFGVELEPLDKVEFKEYVGQGQASLLHLANFIHQRLLPLFRDRTADLREIYQNASDNEKREIEALVKEMNHLDSHVVLDEWLHSCSDSGSDDPLQPGEHEAEPRLLSYSPRELLEVLTGLHTGYRVTLNLTDLDLTDVIELLYNCRGLITHLEIFNLKDYISEKTRNIWEISQLQDALNAGGVVELKRVLRRVIRDLEDSLEPDAANRLSGMNEVLRNLGRFKGFYEGRYLRGRIGSDSTGRSSRTPGMGLAVVETLPARARKKIKTSLGGRLKDLPVYISVCRRTTHKPAASPDPWLNSFYSIMRRIPGLKRLGMGPEDDWVTGYTSVDRDGPSNLISLGGIRGDKTNGLSLDPPKPQTPPKALSWKHLNTNLKIALKVLIGFIPAFLTFYLTKDWWLLSYFGAVIWFGVTGLRNILQSVLGGGGIRRSPLLQWNSYVSWDRLADSLLFTGFSVPLLDYVVKSVILHHGFNITTETNPVALYTVISLANGIYISSHNAFRGLPRGAIVGNFFRSILSIPLALFLNSAIGGILAAEGVLHVNDILEKWAAVISKGASDFVAGIIEGAADRFHNIRMRAWDYSAKLEQLFDVYSRLEQVFPEIDMLELLESPKEFIRTVSEEAGGLVRIIIINTLDLLYFWMYQPRAGLILAAYLQGMSPEERQVFVRSQFILKRHKEISQMFVDGLVGKKFSKALSFYLDRSEDYISRMKKLTEDSDGSKSGLKIELPANGDRLGWLSR